MTSHIYPSVDADIGITLVALPASASGTLIAVIAAAHPWDGRGRGCRLVAMTEMDGIGSHESGPMLTRSKRKKLGDGWLNIVAVLGVITGILIKLFTCEHP